MLIVEQIRRVLLYWILSPGLKSIIVKVKNKFHKSLLRENTTNKFRELDSNIWIKYGNHQDIHAFPLQMIRYQGGISFFRSQHHFLRYYEAGKSSLTQFYKMHQPNNILEAHFLYNDFDIKSPTPPEGVTAMANTGKDIQR